LTIFENNTKVNDQSHGIVNQNNHRKRKSLYSMIYAAVFSLEV